MTVVQYKIDYKGVKSVLTELPGTSRIYFSSDVVVPLELRGKRLGTEAHRHRLLFAAYLGCSQLFCLVQRDNTPQVRILSKFGWESLATDVGSDEMVLCRINPDAYVSESKIDFSEIRAAMNNCRYEANG